MTSIGKFILIVSVLFLANVPDTTFAGMQNFMKLELVQVNFRHGIRTLTEREAKILNCTDSEIYGSGEGFGHLTNEGKYQSYKFGELLRKKYDKFLGKYEASELYAYASKYDRSKMTLQLVLAGLYPPMEEDRWHPSLQWRPIPFDAAVNPCDHLMTPHQCSKFFDLFNFETSQSEEYQSEMAKYNDLFDYIEEKAGVPLRTSLLYYSGWTYYALVIQKILNEPLPQWYSDEILNRLREVFKYNLHAMSLTPQLKRLNGGTMVRQVIENIEMNRNAEKPKKLYLYSHHDLTLVGFEKAQGINAFDVPPFGSAIILEKYRHDNGVEYVRLLAWNGEDDQFFVVKLKGYDEFCPYEDYRKLVKDVIPTDKELEYFNSQNAMKLP